MRIDSQPNYNKQTGVSSGKKTDEQTKKALHGEKQSDSAQFTNAQADASTGNEQDSPAKNSAHEEEKFDFVEFGYNILGSFQGKDPKNNINSTQSINDTSAQLTGRMVSAKVAFEVRQVISAASRELIGLRLIASSTNKAEAAKAQACIKKLEKLISRSLRKIKDLDSEYLLRVRSYKAEQKKKEKRAEKSKIEERKQERRAEEIKEQLRKKIRERKAREQSYLRGHGINIANNPSASLNVAAEARISVQAEAIAAAEGLTSDVGTGSDACFSEFADIAIDGGAAEIVIEGGEISFGEASEGGLDIVI